uniref:Zinc finger protein 692 n=1 Tax=Rousettus aegyptiacus TaxID=9407 RepID=A0A7J8FQQ4_ROUAE|nr:zinc finger protein 692 [Rousettus aegyptiacus]
MATVWCCPHSTEAGEPAAAGRAPQQVSHPPGRSHGAVVPPQGTAGLLPALAAGEVPVGPVHIFRLCAVCRSHAFAFQGSAASCCPVSCPQPRVQSGPTPPEEAKLAPLPSTSEKSWCQQARGEQEPAGLECEHEEKTQEARSPRGVGPSPESFLPPRKEEGEEEDGNEEEVLSDVSPWTYSSSPDGSEPDVPRPPPSPVTHTLERETPTASAAVPTSLPVEGGVQLVINGTPQASQQTEALASPGSQALSAVSLALEEDSEHIGPKRIRRAARRELLPCDFPGCGRIFSNRQYLNHHKKYQHIHQKSFSCPEPACGKSFNFKKHLKEHVKLHSDTRDYICEFCARSFRTSSNLVIHRRIHTGEKPLQCEICGFTCRQKASLNWHRRKHAETVATLRFPCEVCGKRFEKPDSVTAHCSKSHPALLLAPAGSPGPLEPHHSTSAPTPLGHGDGCRASMVLRNDPRD